jgi:hypothetical protein
MEKDPDFVTNIASTAEAVYAIFIREFSNNYFTICGCLGFSSEFFFFFYSRPTTLQQRYEASKETQHNFRQFRSQVCAQIRAEL